jgi:hypothetical protein
MKNGTYDYCEVLVSELQFGVKHPGAGVKTQPHIAVLIFKSYPGQHHIALGTLKYSPGLFFMEHTSHHICSPF